VKILRSIGVVLLAVVALIAVIAFVARFGDGPLGPLPGGPLEAGESVDTAHFDWSSVEQVEEIEFQLLDPPRSRVTWIIYHDGAAYIPCGMPNFTLWKQWPHEALGDGRAVVRIEGKLHNVELVKIDDPEIHAAVAELLTLKYDAPEAMGPDTLWLFRLDPRSGPRGGPRT